MITCPWCGTSYSTFQSSCQKCGGPISPPPPSPSPVTAAKQIAFELLAPPPAPRPFSENYAWRLVFSDGWAIASLVFILIGGIFTITGFPLVIAIVTAFVGIPFTLMGLGFLAAGGLIFYKRFEKAKTTVNVLREGQAVRGQIFSVEMNYNVRVNGRHPWTIRYGFQALGKDYEGQVSTLNPPNPLLQPGNPAYVLYLPNQPENNALYPHP